MKYLFELNIIRKEEWTTLTKRIQVFLHSLRRVCASTKLAHFSDWSRSCHHPSGHLEAAQPSRDRQRSQTQKGTETVQKKMKSQLAGKMILSYGFYSKNHKAWKQERRWLTGGLKFKTKACRFCLGSQVFFRIWEALKCDLKHQQVNNSFQKGLKLYRKLCIQYLKNIVFLFSYKYFSSLLFDNA